MPLLTIDRTLNMILRERPDVAEVFEAFGLDRGDGGCRFADVCAAASVNSTTVIAAMLVLAPPPPPEGSPTRADSLGREWGNPKLNDLD